ncbi:YitT family protein [Neobacillus mesonae]|nr:YitT family protein [Neobacillus mesonae]
MRTKQNLLFWNKTAVNVQERPVSFENRNHRLAMAAALKSMFSFKELKSIGMMLFGTMLMAFAFYHINYVNHLSEGGFVGLALLGSYVAGWSPALTSLLLDIPVILIAWYFMGRKYMLKAMLGAISFSIFYEWCERYSPLVIDLHGSLLAAALISGILTGIGAGIVIASGSATGGDDILAVLVSKWSRMKIGSVFFIFDGIVLLLSLAFMPFKETLYTVLAVWIASKFITLITQAAAKKQQPQIQADSQRNGDNKADLGRMQMPAPVSASRTYLPVRTKDAKSHVPAARVKESSAAGG